MTTDDAADDTPTAEEEDPQPPAEPDKGTEQTDDTPDPAKETEKWKALARKHEQQAKANADAAKRLKEIEDADKTESERLTEALEEAKRDATTTKAELARLRAAIKHGLEEDDLELLGDGDPDEIEARAERLAKRISASVDANGKRPVNALGTQTESPVDPDTWLRDLARG